MKEEVTPDIEEGWYVEHKSKLKKVANKKPSWKDLKKIAADLKKGYILKVEKGWVVK